MEKNREIKFRAWDARTKQMHQDVNPFRWDFVITNTWSKCEKSNGSGILGSGGTEAEFLLPGVAYTDLMQFTGLKDKNGVEIYEGDILLSSVKIKYVVEWDIPNSCFKSETGLYKLNPSGYEFSEIIGNIYQHKELLCKL